MVLEKTNSIEKLIVLERTEKYSGSPWMMTNLYPEILTTINPY